MGPLSSRRRGVQAGSTPKATMSDNTMIGPGAHENAASEALADDVGRAQVLALLALASAVNRLAEAHEANVGS